MDIKVDIELLKRLQKDTNTVLGGMNPSAFREAINWGDLSCFEVVHSVNQEGGETFGILIQEAAPDCWVFKKAVREGLRLMGHEVRDVFVSTEW